jgi:FKBP-type peptidyl-prolyl cis-trans isomerase
VKSGLIAMVTFKGQLLNGDVFQEFNKESFPYVVSESPDFAFQWDPVLKNMRKGETATFIIPSGQAFGEQGYRNLIPPNSPLLLEVKVTDVMSKQEYQEKSLQEKKKLRDNAEMELQKYLKNNNITTAPTQSGLIYIPKKAGNGNKVQAGDTILVHYKGYLLNGDVFDSSYDRGRPMEYVVGSGGLIQGWLEAIPMMEEGEKVQLIIPWRLAYGQQAKGPIPPYSNLVFDMEIVKIKK